MHSILHSTSAPMRFTSGRSWVSQFCFEPRESWQGTTPSVTWSVDVLPQLEPPWQRANRFVTHRRKKAHGRAASLYAGTWRSYALWPNHTSLGPPARQVLQRNSPLLAKRKNMPALEANTSLRPSRSKPWARWTRRHASCLPIWKERSRRQAMTEKELFCSREFRCWCSATRLYCYTTPCQPLTARTDDLYPIVYYLNFKTPSGTYLLRVNNNNNAQVTSIR